MKMTTVKAMIIAPIVLVLLGATPAIYADTGNTLSSTQEILQAANSPGAQNVIAQESQQIGESPQQATDQVVNIVNPQGNGTFTPFELPPRPPAWEILL